MTEHEAIPVVVSATKVHGEPVNEPVPPVMKSTVPVGVGVWLTCTSMSVTSTVHDVVPPIAAVAGLHVTDVSVDRLFTVTTALPLLCWCVASAT